MTSSHTPRLPIQAPEGIKSPVATATIADTDLQGLQTINGYQLNVNDRVLVMNQVEPAQNGIYSAQQGRWTRTQDWKVGFQIANGVLVLDINTGVLWRASFAGVLKIDVTPVTFTAVVSGAGSLKFIQEDVPINNVEDGDEWYKPSEATTYIYYVDEDGGQWVEQSVQSAEGTLRDELADVESAVVVGGTEATTLAKRIAGFVTLEEFTGTPVEKLQAAYDSGASVIKATLSEYDFGPIAGNSTLFTFTRRVEINFNNALLKVQGDNSSNFTETAFIRLKDSGASVHSFVFDDENFLQAGPSRGVQPILILNETLNSDGYSLGNYRVLRGQSVLTAFSTNPNSARARNIRLWGECSGINTYYGLNLANNGDDFQGKYSVDTYKRAFFCYGTDSLRAEYHAGVNGQATSSPLFISYNGRPTKNYYIKGVYDVLNGQPQITNQAGALNGDYRNINIELAVASIGGNFTNANVLTIGPDSAGDTLTVNGVTLTYESEVAFQRAIIKRNATASRIFVNSKTSDTELEDLTDDKQGWVANGKYRNARVGGLSTGLLIPSHKVTRDNSDGIALFSAMLEIKASNDQSFSGQRVSTAIYSITGYVSSGNIITLSGVSEVNRYDVGSAPHPVITVQGEQDGVRVSTDTFTGATALLDVSIL